MHTMVLLMGMIVVVTLSGDGPIEPVYSLKPDLASEAPPQIAATWDRQWIEEARREFARKRTSAEGGCPGLVWVIAPILIIWIQIRRESRRDQSDKPPARRAAPEINLLHALAPRWGLR